MKYKEIIIPIFFFMTFLSGCSQVSEEISEPFRGESAYAFVEEQMSFGPRTPGSSGHEKERVWIEQSLEGFGWDVEAQSLYYQDQGHKIYNIIGTRPSDLGGDMIIIGAHYDTRIMADRSEDLDDQSHPVPGANDGASGVAVVMELARILPNLENLDIHLVFFDAEDNGYLDGWEWILGSSMYARRAPNLPDVVVIVDMVGDIDQQIYFERSSDPELREEIWAIAKEHEITSFIPEEKYHILDDHTPFLHRGIPSVLLIDFDYPYWHTTKDTLDKVSAESLENVGIVLKNWLVYRNSLAE